MASTKMPRCRIAACGPSSCPHASGGQVCSWPAALPPQKGVFSRDQGGHSRSFHVAPGRPFSTNPGPAQRTTPWESAGHVVFVSVWVPSTPGHEGQALAGMSLRPRVLPVAGCPHDFPTLGEPLGTASEPGSLGVVPQGLCVDVGVVLARLPHSFPGPAITLFPKGVT